MFYRVEELSYVVGLVLLLTGVAGVLGGKGRSLWPISVVRVS